MIEMSQAWDYADYVGKNPYRYLALPANASLEQIEDARSSVSGLFEFGEEDWEYDLKGYELLDRSEATLNQMGMALDKNRFLHAMFYPVSKEVFSPSWTDKTSFCALYNIFDENMSDPVEAYDRFLVVSFAYIVTEDASEKIFAAHAGALEGKCKFREMQIFEYLKYANDEAVIKAVAAKRGFNNVDSSMIFEYREKLSRYITAIPAIKVGSFYDKLFTDQELAKIAIPYIKDFAYDMISRNLEDTIDLTSVKEGRLSNLEIMKRFYPGGTAFLSILKSNVNANETKIFQLWDRSEDFLSWLYERTVGDEREEAVKILDMCQGSTRRYSYLANYYLEKDSKLSRSLFKEGVRTGDRKSFNMGVYYMVMDNDPDVDMYIEQMMEFDKPNAFNYKGDKAYWDYNYREALSLYSNIPKGALKDAGIKIAKCLAKLGKYQKATIKVEEYLHHPEFRYYPFEGHDMGVILLKGGATIPGLVIEMDLIKRGEILDENDREALSEAGIIEENREFKPLTNKAAWIIAIAKRMSFEDLLMSTSEYDKKLSEMYASNVEFSAVLIFNCYMRNLRMTRYGGGYKYYYETLRGMFALLNENPQLKDFALIDRDAFWKVGMLIENAVKETDSEKRMELLFQFTEAFMALDYPEWNNCSLQWMMYRGACHQIDNGKSGLEETYYLETVWESVNPMHSIRALCKLVDLEDPSATNNFAYAYNNGIGVKQMPELSFKWYKKAAELGDINAMNNVAHCYYNGIGIEKDIQQCYNWKFKAAYYGNETAKMDLTDKFWDPYRNQ